MDGGGLAANPLQMQPNGTMQRKPKGKPRGPGRPFLKGLSGNPAGKRPGTRNRATLIAEELLDCEARSLVRQSIDDAKGGDGVMTRFCVGRILPPRRERPVRFALPPVKSAADLSATLAAITSAVAQGELTIGEAWELSQIIDTFIRAIDASEFETRLQRLEAAHPHDAKDAREP